MNKFKSEFWNSGKLKEFYYFSFDGSAEDCSVDKFLQTFGEGFKSLVIDFNDYSASKKKKRKYKGNELELEIEKYILDSESDADLFILDTPSVLYTFTKNKKLRDQIHVSMRAQ